MTWSPRDVEMQGLPGSGVAGTGAVGSTLARALHALGYPMHCILSTTATPEHPLVIETGAHHVIRPGDPIPPGLELLFICTPDDVIASTARRLADVPYAWEGVIVAHTSGALTARSLAPLAELGAHTMSFHPVQTFARQAEASFEGVYIGLEGAPEAVEAGIDLANRLHAHPVVLSSKDKALYHASAVFASNFIVTLSSIAEAVLESMGLERTEARALLAPLIQASCHNILHSSPEEALTGPAARGDLSTIERHISALSHHLPEYATLYKELTGQALELAIRSGRLTRSDAARIKDTLSQ